MNEIDKAFAAKTLAQQAAKNAAAAPVVLPPAPQVPASIRDIAPAAQPESASAIAAAGAAGGAGVAKPGMFSGAANRIKNAYNALRDIAPAATPAAGAGTPAGGTPAGGTPAGGTPAGGTPAGEAAQAAKARGFVGRALDAARNAFRGGTPPAAGAAPSTLRGLAGAAATGAKNMVAGAARAAAPYAVPLGVATGAVQALNDSQNGNREVFNASVDSGKGGYFDRLGQTISNFTGADPAQAVAFSQDAIRTLGTAGDTVLGSLPSRTGSGLSSLASGGSFSEGFGNSLYNRMAVRETPSALPQPRGVNDALTGNFAPDKLSPSGPQGDSFGPQDPNKTLYSPTPSAADPVVEDSNQFRTLSSMANLRSGPALTAADFNKPPVDEATLTGVIEDPNGKSMGRDGSGIGGGLLTRQTSAPGITNLGNYGGDSNIYATASTPGGRLNNFFGVGAKSQVYSSAPETAQDKALNAVTKSLSEGSGTENTVSGGGPSSRSSLIESEYAPQLERLKDFPKAYAELMQQKNNALAQDRQLVESGRVANAQLAVQGQGMRNTEAAGRRQDALTLLSQGNAAGATAQKAQEAADRQAADAERQAREIQEKGNATFNEIVSKLYPNADKSVMAENQDKLNSFIASSDLPTILGLGYEGVTTEKDFMALPPSQMRIAVARLRPLMEMQEAARDAGATNTTGLTLPVGEERESSFGDAWDGNMNRVDYMNQVLGLANDKVQPLANGKLVSRDRYIGTDDRAGDREQALLSLRNVKPKK